MKKILALTMALAMMFVLIAACEDNGSGGGSSYGEISWADGERPIALITDYGKIDDESFNQGSWEGVVAFAEANGIPHHYIQPAEVSTAAYVSAIELAVDAGAQIVITPGFLFSGAIFEAQETWPDVMFMLLDATPAPDGTFDTFIADNTVSILYAEEQSGFLAGYAAVMDGYRNLGFIGGIAIPAVVLFGHGYLDGANYAAQELGLAAGDVQVRYTYADTFNRDPAVRTMAASWYADGVEIIFAGAGGANLSVFAAADAAAGAKSIGVDVDQKNHSTTIITSALKELRNSVASVLEDFFAGTFPGGQVKIFDAAIDGIGLPADFSRFNTFGSAEYNAIFAKLVSGEVNVPTTLTSGTSNNPNDFLNVPLLDVTFIG